MSNDRGDMRRHVQGRQAQLTLSVTCPASACLRCRRLSGEKVLSVRHELNSGSSRIRGDECKEALLFWIANTVADIAIVTAYLYYLSTLSLDLASAPSE